MHEQMRFVAKKLHVPLRSRAHLGLGLFLLAILQFELPRGRIEMQASLSMRREGANQHPKARVLMRLEDPLVGGRRGGILRDR